VLPFLFLRLDSPANLDANFETEDVIFTIEFETPDALRMIDASHDVSTPEGPSLMEGE
jgi:hypothetical protein